MALCLQIFHTRKNMEKLVTEEVHKMGHNMDRSQLNWHKINFEIVKSRVDWRKLEETFETFSSWPRVSALAGPKTPGFVVCTEFPDPDPSKQEQVLQHTSITTIFPNNPEQFCVIDIGGWRVEQARTSHGKVKGVGPVWAGDHRLNKWIDFPIMDLAQFSRNWLYTFSNFKVISAWPH